MKFVAKLIMMITIVIGLVFGTASFAQADEPVVDLGGIQYAQAQFSADGSAAAKASLKAASGAKVVLNVHVKPMPKRKIKRCWKVKPGTVIWNEVIDPATGTKKVVRWTVPANDNTFCTKKGAGKQVFKKSCGNRVWGVPGGPKSPPKSLHRIKVKVQIQDYLTFKGKLKVQTSQSGSASAYVVQYYDGQKVCEASSSVSGTGYVSVEAYISVRARTLTRIKVSATNSAQVNANTQITASGSLKAAVKLVLEGKASAMCNFTPPDNPPVFEAPTVDVTPVACVNPGTTRDVTITVSNPNDEADTAKVTYRGQVLPTKPVAAHGQVTFTLANQAAGTYSGTALLVNANKSKSFTVTVEECPPTPPTITEITTINDVVEYNTRTVNVMGTGTPGEIINLFATAKHGGSITAGKNQSLTVDGNGNWSATVEFTAGETPKSSLTYEVDGDSYMIAAGKDVIWFKASNTAGQYVWAKSNDFDITPRPVTP